jgi:hypothetical protein
MSLGHLGPFTHTHQHAAFVTVGPRLMEMQRVQLFFILVHFFLFLAIIVFLCSTNISFCLSHRSVRDISLATQGYLSE